MASQRAGRGTSRPRVSNACQECKRRKLRCDLAKPTCSRCAANRVRCVYDSGSPLIQTRFQFVDEPTLQEGQQEASSTGSGADDSERVQMLERELENLNEQVQELRSDVTRLRSSPEQDMPNTKRRRRTTISAEDLGGDTGHLFVNAPGKTKYVSKAHWASAIEETEAVNSLLRDQERYEVALAIPDGTAYTTLAFGGGLLSPPPAWSPGMITSSKVQSQMPVLPLPRQAACDALFSACMYSIYPLLGVFDVQSFEESYHRFWQDPERKQEHINMPLLTAILFCGSVVCARNVLDEHFPGKSRQQVTAELYLVACRALKWSGFPRAATIETLGAYLLLQPMWLREEEPLRVLSCVGLVVRVAQVLGLNKDPSNFNIFSEAQAEFRRRLWWQIFVVDVLVALASGLPPLIDRDSYDVKPLSLDSVDDPRIGRSITTVSGYHYLKYALRILERSLLDRTLDVSYMTESDVAEMVSEVEIFTLRTVEVKSVVQPDTNRSYYGDNPALNCWVRYIADMLQHKNWWFLYKPALQLLERYQRSSDTDKILEYEELLRRIRDNCRQYLEGFIGMVCNENFRLFHWCWPGIMQPMHHIIILFREIERIYRSAPSAPALSPDISAIRHTIDEALALADDDCGMIPYTEGELMQRPLTEGGQEAWTLIRHIRERLWGDLSLDPHILPTRQAVVENAMARYRLFEPNAPPIPARQSADTSASTQERRVSFTGDTELTTLLGEFRGLEVPNLDVDELDALFES